jgi:hypothetical protein
VSHRVAEAQARAARRLEHQRDVLRLLGCAVAVVVLVGATTAHPAPGIRGQALAVSLVLAAFLVALALSISNRFAARGQWTAVRYAYEHGLT